MNEKSAEQSGSNEEPTFILEIGGEKLALKDYPPITQGDRKTIKKEPYSLNVKNIGGVEWTEEQDSLFALFLLKRVRKTTTLDEVDALPAKTVSDFCAYCLRKSNEVTNPFRPRSSTSSAPSTAGVSATSTL